MCYNIFEIFYINGVRAMGLSGKNELERFTDTIGYNKIWSAITAWIDDHTSELDIEGNDIALDDMNVKFTRNLQIDGCRFTYDAVMETYITYTDLYRESGSHSQWFTVRCAAEVNEDLKSFEVSTVEIYSKKPFIKSAMTENFVPIISKPQMDDEARTFLRRNCPKALTEPTKVPIAEIAKEIGLDLEYGYALSEDFSFFGQISFSDTRTRVFDLEYGTPHELDVKRGTVLLDPEVFWERSIGCENFTIAHEVVHWEKHKLFADIKRLLYRNAYKPHRCPKPASILWESDDSWTDEEWLEWHANGIAARILMPKETVPAKIKEIQATFPPEIMADQHAYFIALIDKLAEFYGTSRLTAKYRLKELGYKAVENIKIHEYDFQAFTHEIDEYKAYYELCENTELRMLTGTGFFTYADNHFVFNHETCVEYDADGVPHLTDFAWANLDKYTLKFRNVRLNIKQSDRIFSDILYRDQTYETFQKYYSEDNSAAFAEARKLAEQFVAEAPKREEGRVTFCDVVTSLFGKRSIEVSDFQALTLLSRDTFYKLKRQDYKPAFETVVALCAGLDMDILDTQDLLRKAGHAFDGSEKHNAYMMVITHFRGKSILVRNEFLRKLNIKGLKPLGEKDAE